MANETQTATTLLRYQVDQGSVNAAVASNNKISSSLIDIRKQADLEYEQMVKTSALDTLFAHSDEVIRAGLVKPIEDASTATKTLIRDIGNLGNDIQAIPEPSLSSFGVDESGGTGGKLRGLREAAIGLPGVGFQSPLVLGLRAAETAADATGASLTELGVAGGLTAVAIAGVALAFNQFTQDITKGKEALTAGISAQDAYFKAVGGSSTKEVTQQVSDLTNRQRALRQQIDETQVARDKAFALEQQLPGGDILARALEAAGLAPGKQLQDQLDALNKEFDTNAQTVDRLSEGLKNHAFAANDTKDILDALAESQKEANKQLAEYNASIKDQITSYEDLITQEVNTRQDIFDTQQKITQLRLDANAKETDLALDKNARIQDIEQAASERQQEIVQNNQDAIAKILRDGGRAEREAIGNRDANALRLATQKEQDALEDASKSADKQQKQIAASTAKQEATVKTSYDKQVRQIETALSQQTAIQQRHLQQDQVDLQNTVNAEIGVAINGSGGLYRIHQSMWSDLGLLASQGVQSILGQVRSLVQNTGAVINSGYNPYTFGSNVPGLPPPSNGGTQGAITVAQAQQLIRNQVGQYIGLNSASGNRLVPG